MRSGYILKNASSLRVWWFVRCAVLLALVGLTATAFLRAADAPKLADKDKDKEKERAKDSDHELIQLLQAQIEELKGRVADLEARQHGTAPSPTVSASASAPNSADIPADPASSVAVTTTGLGTITATPPNPASVSPPPAAPQEGHNMDLPGGPKLNIRGFLDYNFDVGSIANPLIYPLTVPPPGTVHDTFQFGEFDLFMSSRLSNTISFIGEVVLGADASNFWGLDVERAQITYKPSDYLQISGGRMHTAIGWYNTTYHHGTWFQTATGRPYMYFYEDSGGILPVHIVGIEAQGLIPDTGKWNAHWIAEVGNQESSLFIGQPIVAQPVQNFVSDTDHKAFNVAGYIKPDWLPGWQIGGNYYKAERVPTGVPHVANAITGGYIVYTTPGWEFLNEFQVQRDRSIGSSITYNTPLAYTQFSHKFGKYRPYLRWQEINVPIGDPLYSAVGRFEGPSFGLRMDFTSFVALKLQYNRIYTRDPSAKNGLDSQVSFTF
jgi:hypothetical protein